MLRISGRRSSMSRGTQPSQSLQSSSSVSCRRIFAKSRLKEMRLAGKLPLSLGSCRELTSLFHRPLLSPCCRPKSRSLFGAVSAPWRCMPLTAEGQTSAPMSNILRTKCHDAGRRLSPSLLFSVCLSASCSLCLCVSLCLSLSLYIYISLSLSLSLHFSVFRFNPSFYILELT